MNEIHVRRWTAGVFLVIALGIGLVVGSLATAKPDPAQAMAVTKYPSGGGGRVSFEAGFTPVLEKVLPAVVNISSSKVIKTQGGNPMSSFQNDPFFRQFFGNGMPQFHVPREQREHSLGSGVIVRPDGYVLTNNHVVEGASEIKVFFPDHSEYKGKIVGTDTKTDLAVVKIDKTGLPTLAMGNSSQVKVGQFVVAVGDPFGIGETATMGIVSATGRGGLGIEDYEDFIQTDAAINPGNSGGALVNVNGQLVGINTAILTGGGGGNQGVGFAIPINMANSVMQQIIKTGKVTRGWMGVVIQPVTPDIAQAFGLQGSHGALIGDVEPDSPSAKAGLQKGDIILEMNGQPVEDARTLSLKVAAAAPGSTLHLKVFRSGSQRDVAVTLGEMPNKGPRAGNQGGGGGSALEGLSVDNLTADIARQLGLPGRTVGVVVADVADGSAAAEAGLQRGDVIQEVNRQPVRNVEDFNRAVRQAGNKPVLLLVDRNGNTSYVVIQGQ